MSRLGRIACALLLSALAGRASAYRPFDSTDAAVAGPDEFELELGPLGRLKDDSKRFAIAPAVVGNLGFSGDRELVVQGQREVALDRAEGEPRTALTDSGVFIKQVLRRGVLQGQPGLSVATEYGILLPEVHGQSGTGASVAGIVSQRWEAATVHLNSALSYTREHEPDLFLGAILEGPYRWTLRPVAEVFGEQASGSARTSSGLVGAIWNARGDLSFDLGMRVAHAGDALIREFRLGLTWSFPLKKEP